MEKYGRPSIGRAGLEYLGDVGMVHHRQGLAFSLEAGDDPFGVHAELNNLNRNPAADRLFLFSHIHHTEPAFTYQL